MQTKWDESANNNERYIQLEDDVDDEPSNFFEATAAQTQRLTSYDHEETADLARCSDDSEVDEENSRI
jgi:hypothetical protein